ncbi:hypothetical protein XU18_2585 [Perkinsela sp. CCAP 1560/4]|nr:hypothetical protein XU18_2583 [Perkinsela sp. CCAP 1560/4]KNH06564.1 hypothetical protein XU18_2585 [Perkinsela sp. CCAP 1560/4]|eukprot:KNH06562.1 hypothetical protein XU18_2583 [Perkinsela sp. CCAP 1560/4]
MHAIISWETVILQIFTRCGFWQMGTGFQYKRSAETTFKLFSERMRIFCYPISFENLCIQDGTRLVIPGRRVLSPGQVAWKAVLSSVFWLHESALFRHLLMLHIQRIRLETHWYTIRCLTSLFKNFFFGHTRHKSIINWNV